MIECNPTWSFSFVMYTYLFLCNLLLSTIS